MFICPSRSNKPGKEDTLSVSSDSEILLNGANATGWPEAEKGMADDISYG